jgi:queuine tRNA-ribosyltransferase
MPTRNGRNGTLFTHFGKINIKSAKYKLDKTPVDPLCDCYTCKNFSKGYLRHLYNTEEITAYILGTIHNLRFYLRLMEDIREAIKENRFKQFKKEFLERHNGQSV